MASGLATVIVFSSQFLVVGVGAVWIVKEIPPPPPTLCQKVVLESNGYWIEPQSLFPIQGHWVTGLQHMYFRLGRAERAKHLTGFTFT